MAEHLVTYTVVHQPRRIKLPAQPIPHGATPEDIARCLFDERMNERYLHKVAEYCYYPATRMFLEMVQEQDFRLAIGFSLSFLRQAQMWDPDLLALMKKLVAHENVELVCVEPYHSFLFYMDIGLFIERMKKTREELYALFAKRPVVTDTTEMFISNDIYFALDQAGFHAAVLDGREWVMNWRETTHLYNYAGKSLRLLPRHYKLSDDVGYRFSNKGWEGWPLQAGDYAHWIREAMGEFVFLAWDYETFGEHHSRDTGIFEFMRCLPGELKFRGVQPLTPSQALERFADRVYELPLPQFPSTWAGSGGSEFFLGNSVQQAIFQLMHHSYNKARLTGNPELIDLALWLMQSDNLHLIQWFGRFGTEAEVSAYFTPQEWWSLGPAGIANDMQQVYRNFIVALDAYM
ncbi:MAG: glycoside hydrolase [Armatimonadetes bacterium]|nr:glycoside hydrolase [Armatimonadota bacterium]HOM81040.1 glycoside hydrolase family 57 protein [Armatimonadota bacterium]HOQ28667.1 glycoside hydrolase family 57 protein [Armatimonadota bacterium]HPO73479.1 glycoside hydrolase family 57 protein [Armatimonadota bacterium]